MLYFGTAEAKNLTQQSESHHIRPEFRIPLSNVTVLAGQMFALDCELIGVPKPNIFWKLNGKPLLIGDGMKVIQQQLNSAIQLIKCIGYTTTKCEI